MGRFPEYFEPHSLLEAARAIDGLEDFGNDDFREPMEALACSFGEAALHKGGAKVLRGSMVRNLRNRLRLQDWCRRHPEIEDEVIAQPIVVMGMMRSGTTLVQRLLASDPRHYCTQGWEAAEPSPAPDWNPAGEDPRIAAGEAYEQQLRQFAPDYFSIHPSYAHGAEEEILFLSDGFLSHIPEASCDVTSYRSWINDQDFRPAYRHLRRTLQILQWQKKQRGETAERWVLKTPAHLGYLEALFETFPDLHIVHMHRDPVEIIPSGASLNTMIWRMHNDDVDPAIVGQQWLDRMRWTNDRALEVRSRRHDIEARITDLYFSETVRDPVGQIEKVYADAKIKFAEAGREAMESWLAEDRHDPRAAHRYRPEDFGLSVEGIEESFAAYKSRFGLLAEPEG